MTIFPHSQPTYLHIIIPSWQLRLRDTVWGVFRSSKHDNSQCSLAPDYGYKRWSTNREAPRAYTQPEEIGYLVGTVCHGRSNFVNFCLNQNLTSRATKSDKR